MVQFKCPVCNQEYTQGTVEFCSRCCYLLTEYSPDLLLNPEVQERERKRLQSAKDAWSKFHKAYSAVEQQLETAKTVNQNSQNNFLLEQYLQNISSNIQSLPEMLHILHKINENLAHQQAVYQENHFSINETSINETSISQTNSDNEVLEQEDLSNNNDYLIFDTEVYNLVENYNQHGDFPDKIEVSETEYSKSLRWSGSQEPAVFEPNHRGRGDYWIINNQYLVPKPKQKINEHSYQTISILFECFNYEQNPTDHMTLIKPAKVSSINGQEKWQLAEMGSLEF